MIAVSANRTHPHPAHRHAGQARRPAKKCEAGLRVDAAMPGAVEFADEYR